jgi:SAM-dependent methyltransferase
MEQNLNQEYWEERYQKEQTGWDAGSITTPIKEYVDQLLDKNLKILIPGAGNAHEALYLHHQGFKEVYVCDWVAQPLANLKRQAPLFPSSHLIQSDFFELEEANFDLIIEQTFFCALPPQLRPNYVQKMHQLLKSGGQVVGLLFNFPLTASGPPFGGSLEEYERLFSAQFQSIKIEDCYNSIKPRMGAELFIQIQKNR